MAYAPTSIDPFVSIDLPALEKRISTFCKSQGITTDAQWTTAVTAAFNSTNASGLSASTRTLFIEFFGNLVKVG